MRAWVDTSKTCTCCGTTGLQWRKIDNKWKLVDLRIDAEYIHKCKESK